MSIRLLEDGSPRLLEDGSGHRLLEDGVDTTAADGYDGGYFPLIWLLAGLGMMAIGALLA